MLRTDNNSMDVFISYEHESKSIADNICSVLESKGIRCWYAPRDVYKDYATSIVEAIERCRVFVLVLSDKASASPHVLNEVESAYKRIIKGEITIVPFKVDQGTLSKAMEYYVNRLHWIDAVSHDLETAIYDLYKQLIPILGIKEVTSTDNAKQAVTNIDRKNVKYYMPDDKIEGKRLSIEDEFLYEVEQPYYDKLFFGKTNVNAISFGSLNPTATLRRLDRAEVRNILGFSYCDQVVDQGNQLVRDPEHMRFFKLDYSTENIETVLSNAMQEMGIDGFDFVDLSMAIMDMKNPFKVLKKIKKFLKPDAVSFVCDVDEGVVFAYPDEHGFFDKFKEFYKLDTLSGARNTARQIYAVMRKLGAKECKLVQTGINTSNMDYIHKRKLFESWFSFIPNDFNLMLKENPNNETAIEVKEWLDDKYDDIEEEFFDDNFIFNAGYIMYTVKF